VSSSTSKPAGYPDRSGAKANDLGASRFPTESLSDAISSIDAVLDARADIVEDAEEGKRLVARVRTSDASLNAERLKEKCIGPLDTAGFVVPDLIDVTFSGLSATDAPPSSHALDALKASAEPFLFPGKWDAQRCYLAAGGDLGAVPGVLHGLKKSGREGLGWKDICTHRPFSDLAGSMRLNPLR
jgi:hypothetical protein